MKSVLIISSSPRKGGNSDTLCDHFARGAEESGHKVEKVFLAAKKSDTAVAAARAIPHTCVQKDDMAEILESLKNKIPPKKLKRAH